MKFLHLADLHLGKRVCEYSMLGDQREVLKQCCGLASENEVDAVLIAGDVYDKSMPAAEATGVLDEFLCELHQRGLPVYCISGNHDSAERLQFCSSLLCQSGIHIAGCFDGHVEYVDLESRGRRARIHLLPFLRPSAVNAVMEENFQSYEEAVGHALATCQLGENLNILLAHQFVAGGGAEPQTGGSEVFSVGGSEQVSPSLFDGFDYVALGHIHSAQQVGSEKIRYAGSPLKYSLSELRHQKTATLIEVEQGSCHVQLLPLHPLHEMRQIKGKIEDLVRYAEPSEDYIYAVITDREPVYDALGRLKAVYPNLMAIDFENELDAENPVVSIDRTEEKSPRRLFDEFYENRNNEKPSAAENELLDRLFEEVRPE